MDSLGYRIKYLREKDNISQKDFAKKIGVSNTVLSRYESGDRKPDYDILQSIADYFHVSTDYLLGRTDTPEPQFKKENDDFEAWANDPQSNIFFKEFIESPEERKEALLKVWEILKQQGKA